MKKRREVRNNGVKQVKVGGEKEEEEDMAWGSMKREGGVGKARERGKKKDKRTN